MNSMSDLFQDAVSDEYIAAVASVMLRANGIRTKSLPNEQNACIISLSAKPMPRLWRRIFGGELVLRI